MIKPTQQENSAIERIAKTKDGKTFLSYLERFLSEIADVRTIENGEDPISRAKVAKMIEENIVDKFNILSKTAEEEDTDQDFL